jgi:hypothetical protein
MIWSKVQADTLDTLGLLVTISTGNARLLNLDVGARWHPAADWQLATGVSVTRALFSPYRDVEMRGLASVPDITTYADAQWEHSVGSGHLSLEGRASYRGRSRLGAITLRDVAQGRVWATSFGAHYNWDRFAISLVLDNLIDQAGNQFGYGNPFSIAVRDQRTPPRPRNATLGVHVDYRRQRPPPRPSLGAWGRKWRPEYPIRRPDWRPTGHFPE